MYLSYPKPASTNTKYSKLGSCSEGLHQLLMLAKINTYLLVFMASVSNFQSEELAAFCQKFPCIFGYLYPYSTPSNLRFISFLVKIFFDNSEASSLIQQFESYQPSNTTINPIIFQCNLPSHSYFSLISSSPPPTSKQFHRQFH